MTLFSLPKLWLGCAVGLAILALLRLSSCGPGAPRLPQATHAPQPAPKAAAPVPAQPSYTFIGAAPAKPRTEPAPVQKPQAQPDTMAGRTQLPDTALTRPRQVAATAVTGAIPDLDIDLAGHDIAAVMRRYGYVPAVKSRDRLLGKIAGERFVPLSPAELAGFARRGRAAQDYAPVEKWRAKIAAQLGTAPQDLEFLFLVPLATESLFVAAQRQALDAMRQMPENVAYMRGHFDANLQLVIDEITRRNGETLRLSPAR